MGIDNGNLIFHFQQTLMGVIELDSNFIITNINPAAEKIFGYTKDEAIGQNEINLFVPENIREKVKNVLDNLFETKNGNTNINENITHDRKEIICEWFNTPLTNEEGDVVGVASMVQDITEKVNMENELIKAKEELESRVIERTAELGKVNKQLKEEIALQKQTEAALLESNERNTALLQAMPDILFVLSGDGTYIDVRAAREEDLAIPVNELIGKNIGDIGFSKNDLSAIRNSIENVLKTGKRQSIKYELTNPKGLFLYEANIVALNKNEILASVRDITEQRRSEEALLVSESNLKSLIENYNGSIWSVDRDFNYLIYNDFYAAECLEENNIKIEYGMNSLDIFTPELRKLWKQKYDSALSGEKVIFELSRGIDSNRKYFQICMNPILSEGGISGVSAISIEITDQKNIELKIRKAMATAQQYLDIAGVMFLAIDLEGIVTLVNKRLCEISGYKEEELIGNNWFELMIPERIKEDILSVSKKIMQGELEEIEYYENPVKTKSGEEKIIAWHNSLLLDDKGVITGTLSSGEDITERITMEESLRDSEERYRSIFNNSSSVMYIVDPENTRIVDANSAALAFYGWNYKEFTSKSIADISFTGIDQILKNIELTKTNQRRHYFFRNRLSTGEIRNVEVFSSPIKIHGKIFLYSIIHDISDRIKNELKIQTLIKELGKSTKEADFANRAKSTFLANMSHELRTPLNAILGFSQLLEMEKESFDSRQVEFLEYIKNSSNHLLEMVNDILDLSKIEAGKIEIDKKPFDLNQMLARLPMAVKSLVFQKGIELVIDIDFESVIIYADEVRLKQVLYNLLSNAIKFTNNGKKIGIKAAISAKEAVIEVWDEGRGISEKDLEKVFDPFEQVGEAKHQGTGLGLSISKKLIELHGGTLTAESRTGEGSRFIIHIPGIILQHIKETEQKKKKLPTYKRATEKGGNILVVEDNIIHQKFVEQTLNRLGYSVQLEASGPSGIETAMKEDCDLILMDIQLSDMDGIETMKQIRQKCKKRVPIVALTAYAMKGDLEKYKSKGFDGYVSKPIVIERLKETLENLLE